MVAASSLAEIFFVALRLGCTSFGGPVAHLGYFHREYVERRRWLEADDYAALVALAQALPGPASSQVGMAVGYRRAGLGGAVAAWLGFTLPSALLMVAAALAWSAGLGTAGAEGALRGLGLAAVAVVTQAVWSLGRSLVTRVGQGVLLVAILPLLALGASSLLTIGLLVLGALLGWRLWQPVEPLSAPAPGDAPAPRATLVPLVSWMALGLLALLLVGLPWLHGWSPWGGLADGFYRAGALVFGGGHVVLPLLKTEFVGPGGLSPEAFLAGYGLAQALPGPLFTFASYLGYLLAGPVGAVLALVAVFLPSFLLVVGVLPYWARLRSTRWFPGALSGVNVVVVGLLAWAWYDPVVLSSVHTGGDAAVVVGLSALLLGARWPSWAVVVLGVGAGWGLSALAL